MDMPITVPRISASQAIDDLKARNMILCRFPEVAMATGKVGRADTAFDPAPLDMIETMVEFRPRRYWPARRLLRNHAESEVHSILQILAEESQIAIPQNVSEMELEVVQNAMHRFDAISREVCWQLMQEWLPEHGKSLGMEIARDLVRRSRNQNRRMDEIVLKKAVSQVPQVHLNRLAMQLDELTVQSVLRSIAKSLDLTSEVSLHRQSLPKQLFRIPTLDGQQNQLEYELVQMLATFNEDGWKQLRQEQNRVLKERAGVTWCLLVLEEIFARVPLLDSSTADLWDDLLKARYSTPTLSTNIQSHSHGLSSLSKIPIIVRSNALDRVIDMAEQSFRKNVWLVPHDQYSLTAVSSELDETVKMPGWANVWTRPIQNRVDMLTTSVHSEIGIRVLGDDLDTVVKISDEVAGIVANVEGMVGVLSILFARRTITIGF